MRALKVFEVYFKSWFSPKIHTAKLNWFYNKWIYMTLLSFQFLIVNYTGIEIKSNFLPSKPMLILTTQIAGVR